MTANSCQGDQYVTLYLMMMARKRILKKRFLPLLLAIFCFIAFIILVITTSPSSTITVFKEFPLEKKFQELISTNMLFFILVFATVASLFTFIFNNLRRGTLIGLFFVCFL